MQFGSVDPGRELSASTPLRNQFGGHARER
jgi:hypothetical protein